MGVLCCVARIGSLLGVLLVQFDVFHGTAAAAAAGAAFVAGGVAVVLLPEVALDSPMPEKTKSK